MRQEQGISYYKKLYIMLSIAYGLYIFMFIFDVAVLDVQVGLFTAFYGGFYFPLFAILYAILSFKYYKRVLLPIILHVISSLLFVCVLFAVVWPFRSGYCHIISSPVIKRALEVLPIIALCTLFSVLISIGSVLITFLFTKLISKLFHRNK